ncbi:MAG: DUF4388 domain-containing protein [Acidobacteriia bacterium]|nr:DUF4388 domain-containing protein [Terriglobia bacterium]
MSLAGHLSELGLPDLLQIVAMAEKSGRLDLTTRDGEGLIVFRAGRIIYAASNAARETLGSMLVCRRLISEETLRRALDRQHRSHEERRLGSILVQMGAMSQDAVEAVIYEQVQHVIGELVKLRDGYFKFEPMEIPDHGEVGVDAREFLAREGFNANKIALELSRLADEAKQVPGARAVPTPPANAATGRARSTKGTTTDRGTKPSSSLGTILADQPVTSLTAEATMEVLRAGAAVLSRGVLLLVERFGVTGVGQFGLGEGDKAVDEGIRNLWIPLDGASVLADVVVSGTAFRGPLPHTEVSELLVGELGGGWPTEAAVLPVKVGPRVVALLYGDGIPGGAAMPALARLEARLAEIGAAMTSPEPARQQPS